MTPERWAAIKDIAARALERPPEDRAGFLDRACPDAEIREEVVSLLSFEKDSYLETMSLAGSGSGTDLEAGTKLGDYQIVSRIGAGAMGEVYRGRDIKLGRDVAIKVLPKAFSHVGERLERFEREARLLASLNHRGIATLHGLERAGDVRCLVMELVEGETLEERIDQGAIPVDEAVALAKQIAEALEAAHQKHVIHRDLKPANIKVTPDGRVKILDFGLAKAIDPPSDTSAAQETRAGTILGTAAYMSPEQVRAQPVDTRTDIWAFGCVLYEMLTGRQAFAGEGVPDVFAAVVGEEPDWNALPASTPIKVKDMLRRCLRKDAFTRLRDIGDARIELDDAWNERLDSEKPPARRSLSLALVAMSLATVLALGLLVWGLTRSSPSSDPITRVVVPLDPANVLARHDALPAVAISPDGRHVAYIAGERSNFYLRAMDAEQGELVSGTEDTGAPFFSPDGRWVGFYSRADRKLVKVSVEGGRR